MFTLDYNKYAEKIRQAVAESVVLLKNENNTLPITQDAQVAVFGRAQIDTYYCGTGSGGMVNVPYVVNFIDGLKAKRNVDEALLQTYVDFVAENPFDKGQGWAQEPFSQKELVISDDIASEASKNNGVAVFVVGRSAGEDKDCAAEGGSYYLSDIEKANLALICKHFEKVVVVLNVGGIMDMSFIDECSPSAIVYAWHGGIESGNGYADVLCGDVNPSGVLPNTIAYKLEDYPSTQNFGDDAQNIYAEDIFVGYRYFETFAKEKVIYPFGYGLSYTSFAVENTALTAKDDTVAIDFTVTNTGKLSGKKVVQVYCQAPVVALAKAKVVLVGFAKTKELAEGESQKLTVVVTKKDMASFDDNSSLFVLEHGSYVFSIGFNSRELAVAGELEIQADEIIEKCTPALMPIKPFEKMTATVVDGEYKLAYNTVNTRGYDIKDRVKSETGTAPSQTNFGYTFADVKAGKITATELANDLSDLELIQMSRGEGMCSPKVTPGTAGAFGGVTDMLKDNRKMPIACCSDGPSGIRMDCGTMAISIPNATAIASTFNLELVAELFEFLSMEMVSHKVDTLLGPGMNIHRNPLCGRNFEYYSEDPFLTGKMATAQLKVMNKYNITGTIKHFAANNQEKARKTVDAAVSARALREIYLKGFEMAVKDGGAYSVMTSYNPINGTQAASNYDLNTTILRKDWGFDGVVMTDWWATMNKEGGESSEKHTSDMIISQNDVFMVCASSQENSNGDDSETEFANGNLTRYPLVRNAVNIIETLLRFNCSRDIPAVELVNVPENSSANVVNVGEVDVDQFAEVDCSLLDTTKGTSNNIILNLNRRGEFVMEFDMYANAVELAQIPMSIKINGSLVKTITLKGGTSGVYTCEFGMFATINTYLEMFFGETGMDIKSFTIKRLD